MNRQYKTCVSEQEQWLRNDFIDLHYNDLQCITRDFWIHDHHQKISKSWLLIEDWFLSEKNILSNPLTNLGCLLHSPAMVLITRIIEINSLRLRSPQWPSAHPPRCTICSMISDAAFEDATCLRRAAGLRKQHGQSNMTKTLNGDGVCSSRRRTNLCNVE